MKILDVGCGSSKRPGAIGLDIYAYPGVDIVCNLESFPWPVEENSFDQIICQQVIEHIDDITAFMKELHRVGKKGCQIEFTTPHYSSVNSWTDPTHRKHLSLQWYKLFTDGYLKNQTGAFRLISSEVFFGKTWRAKIGKWIARWRGAEKWEKSSAFVYPATDIKTVLEVLK